MKLEKFQLLLNYIFSNISEIIKYTVMKQFKIIDFWISSLLIAGFAMASMINMDYTFLMGYIVVGSWQVISMIVHLAARSFIYKSGARYVYNWITLIALVTIPLGSFWILLFTAPFMAVYYTYLCYRETYIMMQRPLALLK